MTYARFFIPLVGAFIGWVTNVIAISLLFHPYKSRMGIQGLIPKNRDKIAERLGKIIEEHLLDDRTVIEAINLEEKIREILNKYISRHNSITKAVLKNMVNPIAAFLKNQIEKELRDLPSVIDVDLIIEEKVKQFDIGELEKIIYRASGSELRFIQLAGAFLGFIIGLVQILLLGGF